MSAAAPRRRATPAAVAAIVALLTLVLAVGPAPTGAQTPPPTTPRSGPTTGPRIDLAGQTPFVAPTDILRIDLDLAEAPEGAELTFTIRSPVTGPAGTGTAQSRFDTWVAGAGNADDLFNSPKTFPVANLPAGSRPGTVSASFQIVPGGEEEPLVGFRLSDAGVYPLTVTLSAEGGAPLDSFTTFLVRLPTRTETAPPLAVAAVADLHAPVALAPDGTRTLDPGALDRIRVLVDTLTAHPDVAVTVDPTPETLESLFATGPIPASSAGPATTGADLLERIRRSLAGRSVLGRTYVDLDVSAWTRSGMGAAFAYQLSHGVDVARSIVRDAAPIDETTWTAAPGLTADALAQLHELGTDQVVLPASAVGPIEGRDGSDPARLQVALNQPFDVTDATGARIRAMTSRPTFGDRLTATDDEALNAQILVADLAVTYFGAFTPQVNDVSDTRRGVTFEIPDDELALRSLGPFLAALATAPPADGGGTAILAPSTLASLFAIPPLTAGTDGTPAVRALTPDPGDSGEDMGDYPERFDAADFAVSAYESMVVDTEPQRVLPLRQLLDVSGAAELTPSERQAYLDASNATVDAQLAGIRIPEQDQINLTATDQDISVVVENDLSYPVTVRIELASSKLTFPEGDDFDVQLEPGRNRLPVTVNTVSGGTFPVEIAVRSPDSRRDLGRAELEVRSTAVSGLGLALTIGAGFFLLVWWARNWRRTRRTGAAALDADGPEPPEPDGTVAARPAGFTVGPLADLTDAPPVEPAADGSPVEPVEGQSGDDAVRTRPVG